MADQNQGRDEATQTRGIDGQRSHPGAADGQEVHAPAENLDKVSSYTGSLSKHPNDRPQSQEGTVSQRKGDASAAASESKPRMEGATGGQLESDEGVAEQEKDPIE
jgi:hypothetical protein